MISPIKIPYKTTQAELAKALGLSQSYVSRLLRNKVNNPKRVKEIKEILNNIFKA